MTKITLLLADITELKADAIVNPALSSLLGGGGVDAAIHEVAGPELKQECSALGGCEVGKAKITKGYELPAKHVIHTVAPVFGYEDRDSFELLSDCYRNSLSIAKDHGLRTIAFPAISTGHSRHFPKDKAAGIALDTVRGFVDENPDAFDEVIFTVFSDFDHQLYKRVIAGEKEITMDQLQNWAS